MSAVSLLRRLRVLLVLLLPMILGGCMMTVSVEELYALSRFLKVNMDSIVVGVADNEP